MARHLLILCVLLGLNCPARSESIRFAVLGDSRGSEGRAINEEVFPQIVEEVGATDPPVRFVVFLGDLVSGSDYDQALVWQLLYWRKLARPWYDADMLGAKVYPVPGNHDQPNPLTYVAAWQEAFPELPDNGPDYEKKLTYSFDFGPCHLVAINTSSPIRLHWADLDWLADDLSASDAPVKLVFGHEPAYPKGGHIGSSLDAYPARRDRFWQILVENGVRAYFCGHVHSYDHWIKDGVHQIISGGAGAPGNFFHYLVVDAGERDVTVSVYRHSGDLHEQYKLSETENVAHEPRITEIVENDDQTWCSSIFACLIAAGVLACNGLCRFDILERCGYNPQDESSAHRSNR